MKRVLAIIHPWRNDHTTEILAALGKVSVQKYLARNVRLTPGPIAEIYAAKRGLPFYEPMIADLTGRLATIAVLGAEDYKPMIAVKEEMRRLFDADILPKNPLWLQSVIHMTEDSDEFGKNWKAVQPVYFPTAPRTFYEGKRKGIVLPRSFSGHLME